MFVGVRLAVDKVLMEKLICLIMRKGKKELARKIVQQSMQGLANGGGDPKKILKAAIARSAPSQVTRGMRKGAQKIRVPFPVKAQSRAFIGLKLLVEEAKKNAQEGMGIALVKEIRKAASNQGGAVQRKRKMSSEGVAGNVYMRWS